MKTYGLMLTIVFAWTTGVYAEGEPRTPSGHTPLFNGTNLDGWEFVLRNDDVPADQIWVVTNGLIYCEGTVDGYMRTKEPWQLYQLSLDWRWPHEAGNSGLFIHIHGMDEVWPLTFEVQLKSGNAGDVLTLGGSSARQATDTGSQRIPRRNASSENPAGEWNRMTVICQEDRILVSVNGILQNLVTGISHAGGYIGLQSEGTPIEFRNVTLAPLDE